MTDDELERRISERAYQIWLDEGKPEGRAEAHWELARLAIAQQDGLPQMLKSPQLPGPDPIDAWTNQGELPTLIDQGEGLPPVETKPT